MFQKTKHIFIKKILALILLFSGLQGESCSCEFEFSEFTPYFLTYYDHVIVCKPISVKTINRQFIYKAIVSKAYWGTKHDTVTITTSVEASMCGRPLTLSVEYLVYGDGENNHISISSCGRTRELDDKSLFSFIDSYDSDSFTLGINGCYKAYSKTYVRSYFTTGRLLEIKYLELISQTLNGKIITKFTNEIVSAEISFKDGKFNSSSKFNFPNGKIKSCGNFTNNSKDSIWIEAIFKEISGNEYYLSRTGVYIDNKKRGVWIGTMLIGSYKEFVSFYNYPLDEDYH